MKRTIEEQIKEYDSKQYNKLFTNALVRIKITHIIATFILIINASIFTDNTISQAIQFVLAFVVILHDFDDGYIKQILSKSIHNLHKSNNELKENNSKLEEISTIDFLTKIPNRRYFFDIGEKEYHLARRYKNNLALLFLDIDFFKKINDNFGHATGDEVLKLVALTLAKSLRKSDVCARAGGEEFAILLINTKEDGALQISQTLRKKIEDLVYTKGDIKIKLTISIGLTILNEEDKNIDDIFKRADEALYISKENGRNQVNIKL